MRGHLPRIGRQRLQPSPQQAAERVGKRYAVTGKVDATGPEGATDLDHVEGVPSRQPMDALQHRRAELQAERLMEEPIDLARARAPSPAVGRPGPRAGPR